MGLHCVGILLTFGMILVLCCCVAFCGCVCACCVCLHVCVLLYQVTLMVSLYQHCVIITHIWYIIRLLRCVMLC